MSSNALLWPSQGTKPEERLDKYKYLRLPSQGVGGIGAAPPGGENPLLAIYPPIADATFQFYKFYQIKKSQVPSLQTNQPLVIIDTLGAGIIQEASGFDIRVFDSSGVPLNYEVQSVNPSTGDFIIWINLPTVQDLEFVQLTFGKPTATDGQNKTAVWDANYKSVHHQQTNGDDSTINAQNFTESNVSHISGKIGNGGNYAGNVNSFSQRFPYTGAPTINVTVEFWIKNATVTDEGMFSYAAGTQDDEWNNFGQINLLLQIKGNNLVPGNTNLNDGIFHHVVTTWRSSDGLCSHYIDSVLESTGNISTGLSILDNGSLVLGQDQDTVGGGFQAAQAFEGILDEIKWSNIVRSADWIKTEFNNQNDNNAFWFETPLLENGEDNFLVDDMGRNIVAVLP